MLNSKLLPLGNAGGESYWILKFEPTTSGNPFLVKSVVSSDGTDDGNIYWYCSDSSLGHYLIKMDKDGNISTVVLRSNYYWGNLQIDSSENVYLIHNTFSGSYRTTVLKFNSNLVLQSQYEYTTSGANPASYNPANDIYNNDLYLSNNYSDFYPGKRPTAFVVDGATLGLVGTPYSYLSIDDQQPRALKVDNGGNIWIHSNFRNPGGSDAPTLLKFGTNFSTVSFVQQLGSNSGYGQDLDFDASNNVYVCGKYENGYPNVQDNYVAKFNSSGTLQWHNTLKLQGDANYGDTFSGGDGTISTFSIGQNTTAVYTVTPGYQNVQANFNDYNITKWNSSTGAFVESYGISCTTTSPGWKDPQNRNNTHCMTTETAVYIPGKDQANNFYLMKLPLESASGIYGNYTLDGVSFKIGANNAVVGTTSSSWNTQSSSTTARTFTAASASYGSSSTPAYTTFKQDL